MVSFTKKPILIIAQYPVIFRIKNVFHSIVCWQSSLFCSKKQEQLRNGIRNSRREQWSWEDPISRVYECDFLGRLTPNHLNLFFAGSNQREVGGSFHTFMLDQNFSVSHTTQKEVEKRKRRLAAERNQGNAALLFFCRFDVSTCALWR